jgi:hypothetical protein
MCLVVVIQKDRDRFFSSSSSSSSSQDSRITRHEIKVNMVAV